MHWLYLLLVFFLFSSCDKSSASEKTKKQPPANELVVSGAVNVESSKIAALIDPAKLATLAERGANSRVQKITAILWSAKEKGEDPAVIAGQAVVKIGWGETQKGNLTVAAMLRNLDILEKLGATTPADIEAMRKGKSATVRKGPYAGDIISVDHIIPRAVAPELDCVIANLELMPLRLNMSKNDGIGDRQRDFAKKFHAAGLLQNPEKVR